MTTAEISEPMFRSVGQALSVAFAVADTDPAVKGTMEGALNYLAEKRYGAAPILNSERAINRQGLNDNEFRTQCVMVVAIVNTRLAGHERDTIVARFGKIAARRAAAVRSLCEAYASLCSTTNREAVLALCWSIYAPGVMPLPNETPSAFNARRKRRKDEWSARTLETEYGVGRNILNRDKRTLRELFDAIELQAQGRLEIVLVKAGLVGEYQDSAVA